MNDEDHLVMQFKLNVTDYFLIILQCISWIKVSTLGIGIRQSWYLYKKYGEPIDPYTFL